MARWKVILVENGEQEILSQYDNVDDVIYDMEFKDPNNYFIGDETDKQGYTLEQFKEKFKK